MKPKALSELEPLELTFVTPMKPLEVRRRRLERFATLLEAHSGPIRLLNQVEGASRRRRRAMRRDFSPFSVAFGDSLFRAEGMQNDTYGEGMRFFDLSAFETHELVCDCHYFGPVTGATIAERARFMAAHPGMMTRVKDFMETLNPWSAARR